MAFKLPTRGLVFWPVGNGDSTTISIDGEAVLQVDLNHLGCSEDDEDKREPVVDRLVECLPKRNGKPYLAAFVLTHPDRDHCCGFADLLRRVDIGELWFSPRVFGEYKDELCDDAQAFRKEALRRRDKTITLGLDTPSGDRIQVIGYDDLLKDDDFKGFPRERLTVPGNSITEIDGRELAGVFKAFIHAPFKDDANGDRNGTSIGMQVSLFENGKAMRAMLLGDLSYPIVSRIFKRSQAADLAWNVFQTPHHCSKSVMYWRDNPESEETLRQDVLDMIKKAKGAPAHIVSSSMPIPERSESGDNPPHARAKNRYEELGAETFTCTQEHPSEKKPEPLVIVIGAGGAEIRGGKQATEARGSLSDAVRLARGAGEPPATKVGFGA